MFVVVLLVFIQNFNATDQSKLGKIMNRMYKCNNIYIYIYIHIETEQQKSKQAKILEQSNIVLWHQWVDATAKKYITYKDILRKEYQQAPQDFLNKTW